jgi:hypothetical protein
MPKRLTQQTEEKSLATTAPNDAEWRVIEGVVIGGDLTPLTPEQRVRYMQRVCTGLGLNWETSPFIYVKPADKLILYATKDCAAQLRRRDGISIEVTGRSFMPEQGIYCVEVKATNAQGRSETAIGSVGVMGMKHETLAGQMMRAETKAKRRVTLSLCGLGLDGEDDMPAFSPIGNGSAKGDRTTDSLMAGNAAADGREAGAQPSAIKGLIVSDQQSASVSAATLAEAAPFVASPTAAASAMQTLSENITREAAKADQPPKRDIVDKAKEILGPLGFVVTDETASPAALDDEIEVLADELVALNDALGEKKTTVKAIRAWAQKTFPNDLAAQAAELKKRVEDKRAKVASLSTTA